MTRDEWMDAQLADPPFGPLLAAPREAAIKKTLDGIDLPELEKAWKTWTANLVVPRSMLKKWRGHSGANPKCSLWLAQVTGWGRRFRTRENLRVKRGEHPLRGAACPPSSPAVPSRVHVESLPRDPAPPHRKELSDGCFLPVPYLSPWHGLRINCELLDPDNGYWTTTGVPDNNVQTFLVVQGPGGGAPQIEADGTQDKTTGVQDLIRETERKRGMIRFFDKRKRSKR